MKFRTQLIVVLFFALNNINQIQAACSAGNEICVPWETNIVQYPPTGLAWHCDYQLQSVDVDYNTIIVTGGRTNDANTVLGQTTLNCYDSNYRGYINRFTSGVKAWEKFIHGNFGSQQKNAIVGVYWVGLSRDAQANTQGVYTTHMAAYIRMTYTDLVAIMDLSNGDFLNIQHIQLSDTGTLSGYDFKTYFPQWQDMFKFQLLTHGSTNLADYRIFYTFIDKSTFDNKKWTLHSRSNTTLLSTIDSTSPGKYIYGASCIEFYNGVLYWGGGREQSNTNVNPKVYGVAPILGTSDPTTMAVSTALAYNGPSLTTSQPRYIVEKIYLSRASNNLLTAFARKRYNTKTEYVDQSDKIMLIVGKDASAASPWLSNVGCFHYSVYLIEIEKSRTFYIDDVVGPITSNNSLHVFIRTWRGNYANENFTRGNITNFEKIYELKITNFDGVQCVAGKDAKKTTGIDIIYDVYEKLQCKTAYKKFNHVVGRIISTSRTLPSFMASCTGESVEPWDATSSTIPNSGRSASILYKLNVPAGSFNKQSTYHTLYDQWSWDDIKSEFTTAATSTTQTLVPGPGNITQKTLPSTTVTAAGGYPAMVIDKTYELTAVSTIETFDYGVFFDFDNIAQTHYHFQQYNHPTQQTFYSNNDITSTSRNYTGTAYDGVLSLNYHNSNTKIRLSIQRQSTNRPYKDYYFYIGGANIWKSALSPLYHVKLVCPPSPVPKYTQQNLKNSVLTKGLLKLGNGWKNVFWNPWKKNEYIPYCGFLRYELTVNATTAPLISYNAYSSSKCDQDETKCNYVRVTNTIERKLYFDISARRVDPWNNIASTQQYFIYITDCLDMQIKYQMQNYQIVFDRNMQQNYKEDIKFKTSIEPLITQYPPNKNCPPDRYELYDYVDPSKNFSNTRIYPENLNNRTLAGIKMQCDLPMKIDFYLKIYSFVDTYLKTPIQIIVCGNETIRLANNEKQVLMYQLDTVSSTTHLNMDYKTLSNYFIVSHYATNACTIKNFFLFKTLNSGSKGHEAWDNKIYPELQLYASSTSTFWRIQKDKTFQHNLWLGAETKGLNFGYKQFEVNVCSENSIVKSKTFVDTYAIKLPQYASNSGGKGQYLIQYRTKISQFFAVENCPYCAGRLEFQLLYPGTSVPFKGFQAKLSADNDLVLYTSTPIHNFNLTLRIGMQQNSLCNFINHLDILFDIEICGYERVVVRDYLEAINITRVYDRQRNVKLSNISDMFTLQAQGSLECPITKYEIWGSRRENPTKQGPQPWTGWIMIVNNDLVINHNYIDYEKVQNNTQFKVYITAVTYGNQIGQKTLIFTLRYPPRNQSPRFTKDANIWKLKIYGDDQWKGYDYPIVQFDLPEIDEKDNLLYQVLIKQPQAPCKCIKVHEMHKTTDNPDVKPKVWITVDRSWITHKDGGNFNTTVEFVDFKSYKSFESSYQEFQVQIHYIPSIEKEYDPVEFYRLKRLGQLGSKGWSKEKMNKRWFNWMFLKVIKKSESHITKYPRTHLIDPTISKTRQSVMVDRDKFLSIIRRHNSEVQFRSYKKNAERIPVQLKITQITQNGQLRIDFNQKLIIPPLDLITQSERLLQSNNRILQDLYKINVQRDIFEFKYRLRNKIEPESIVYDVNIKEWTEWCIILQLSFLYPRNVSLYDSFDHAIIKINNPNLFVSAETGIAIDKDYRLLQEAFPKQYGTSIDTFRLQVNAQLFVGSITIIVTIMIIYCAWFGYSLRDLWILLYVAQIVVYMAESDVYFPITAGIFIDHLRRLIQFDFINPFFYVYLANSQFTVDRWILGRPYSENLLHKDQLRSYLNDYSVYIFWSIIIFITFWIFKAVKRKTKKPWIRKMIRNFNWLIDKKLYFNGFIRIFSILYIQLCFSCFKQLEMWTRGSKYQGWMEKLTTILVFFVIVFSLIGILYILMINRRYLGSRQNRKIFSNFYEGVHLYRDSQNVWYFPIFLTRRLIFAATPFMFPMMVGGQICSFMYQTLFYLSWYAYFRPQEDKRLMKIECFNQFMILIITYVCILFTELNVFEESFNSVGTLYVVIVCIIILVNLGLIMQKAYSQWVLYNTLHDRQRSVLLKNNPDAGKPKIKKQQFIPKYYSQNIGYKLSEEKAHTIKLFTLQNLGKSHIELQNMINKELALKLGTFGDIVELARQNILVGYCQPLRTKESKLIDGILFEKRQVYDIPKRLPPFIITFDRSSRNRWDAFYGRDHTKKIKKTDVEKICVRIKRKCKTFKSDFQKFITDCGQINIKSYFTSNSKKYEYQDPLPDSSDPFGTNLGTQSDIDHQSQLQSKDSKDKKKKKGQVEQQEPLQKDVKIEELFIEDNNSDSDMYIDDYNGVQYHGFDHKTLQPGEKRPSSYLLENLYILEESDEDYEEDEDEEDSDETDDNKEISSDYDKLSSFQNSIKSPMANLANLSVNIKKKPSGKKYSHTSKLDFKLDLDAIKEEDEWNDESKTATLRPPNKDILLNQSLKDKHSVNDIDL